MEFTRNEVLTSEFNRTTKGSFGVPPVWEIKIPARGIAPRHAAVVEAFANAVLSGTPLIAKAEEGLASAELANAILYSSFKGQKVNLPLDPSEYETFLNEKMKTSRFHSRPKPSAPAPVANMAASFN